MLYGLLFPSKRNMTKEAGGLLPTLFELEARELAFSAAHINLLARFFQRTEEEIRRENKNGDFQEKARGVKPNRMER